MLMDIIPSAMQPALLENMKKGNRRNAFKRHKINNCKGIKQQKNAQKALYSSVAYNYSLLNSLYF